MTMHRLFGLETEYGLYVEGKDASDLVEEARQVVQAYPGKAVTCWDYGREDPYKDMRGFRAQSLAANPEDRKLDKPDAKPLSLSEDKRDRLLTNGGRLYNDHGHPEYATPECSSIFQLLAHDKAGERIVLDCARRRAAQAAGRKITIYKNNTDFHGMSYGCHENYLVQRSLPFDKLLTGILPFLITRQIFAGAGKVGIENARWGGPKCRYQLSQRADFCDVEVSVDTLHHRPIVNTRDEPHADAARFRRFHVILGDANMSQYAEALKAGTTALVLSLLETGWDAEMQIEKPVEAIKSISRDESFQWAVKLGVGNHASAVEIQSHFLNQVRREFAGRDEESDWILREWKSVLEKLSKDPLQLSDRLDWVAKRCLLQSYVEAENIPWTDEVLKTFDLEYHNIDPEAGLFYALEQAGEMPRLVDEIAVQEAVESPPPTTRALIRGMCIKSFSQLMKSIQWEAMSISQNGSVYYINLSNTDLPEQLLDEVRETFQNEGASGALLERLVEQVEQRRSSHESSH